MRDADYLKDGHVEQSNFHDYRVLRIHETPQIDVHLVKSTEAPGGIGEPGTSCLMPALTNAVYAATAKRIRKLPVATQLRGVGGSAKATLLEVNKVKA
jgi:isoquinoline 1-oxidoreductase beta subunit